MQNFLNELPTLIVTLALLGIAALLVIFVHSPLAEIGSLIISPLIAFWFLRQAFAWQPVVPAPLAPPTSMRPITSNAYIPPDIRASLGVPARASAVQPPAGGNPVYDEDTSVVPTVAKP